MSNKYIYSYFFLFFPILLWAQPSVLAPTIEERSFDEQLYKCEGIHFQSFAETEEGYWLFEPSDSSLISAPVLVFLHGYGGYNPMIYGKWIKHLVRQGNIVIYPRYQKNLRQPKPDIFAPNVAKAIQDAKEELSKGKHLEPIWDDLTFVGHSYGGVIAADLAIHYEKYAIPPPQAIMLCSPGTAYLKKGRLETYKDMPPETKVVIVVSDDDKTTGDEFGLLVYETATKAKNRVLYRQYADRYGKPSITAGHNQSYCIDKDFDTGVRNYTALRALGVSTLDAVDFNGYWRLFDALIDCQRNNEKCDFIFGREGNYSLGKWKDGTEIRALEVIVPR